MTDPRADKVEQVLDRLAAKSDPTQVEKIDRQFADKLERLANDEHIPPELVAKLRVLWKLLRAPESDLPWQARALVMAALSYFISPFDLIPDVAGKTGYIDDAMVVGIVYRRLAKYIDTPTT